MSPEIFPRVAQQLHAFVERTPPELFQILTERKFEPLVMQRDVRQQIAHVLLQVADDPGIRDVHRKVLEGEVLNEEAELHELSGEIADAEKKLAHLKVEKVNKEIFIT